MLARGEVSEVGDGGAGKRRGCWREGRSLPRSSRSQPPRPPAPSHLPPLICPLPPALTCPLSHGGSSVRRWWWGRS
eukprot:2986698-Rhodomonas_salina.1